MSSDSRAQTKTLCASVPSSVSTAWAVKQKVSGCFRTEEGAAELCRLMSYVSTTKKQGHSVMETIRSLFAGQVLMPAPRC